MLIIDKELLQHHHQKSIDLRTQDMREFHLPQTY